MTINEAIQKAIGGGYIVWGGEVPPREYSIVFLDPLFWQCLGKAAKFEINTYSWQTDEKGEQKWLTFWHKFIDHLASGGKPEDYFQSL